MIDTRARLLSNQCSEKQVGWLCRHRRFGARTCHVHPIEAVPLRSWNGRIQATDIVDCPKSKMVKNISLTIPETRDVNVPQAFNSSFPQELHQGSGRALHSRQDNWDR